MGAVGAVSGLVEQRGWLPTRSGRLFATLHSPGAGPRHAAVVLVPPFGWEGVASARNLRGWARGLAGDGFPTLRYQPPGSGDSEGDGADQDLTTWSGALVDLVEHARQASGCQRVAVVGLGLGGLVALAAVDLGARVDDLVLWATPVKGRLLMRELRAFAAMAAEPGSTSGRPPQPLEEVVSSGGVLWVHGYPLSASAQEQLGELDAAALDLSGVRRALVLGRGTLPPDRKLAQALTAAGADTTSGPGRGYDELTVEPRLSRPAREVAATVTGWLSPGPIDLQTPLQTVPVQEERVELDRVDAIVLRARDASLTAVFVGCGAQDRSGPNRLWTETARRWADWGISSLRLDLPGIGEAPGPDVFPFGPEGFYAERYRSQVQSVLDAAPGLGLPDRFLLLGLCSGGYWAAQVGLDDQRVSGVVALNAVSLVWPPPLLSADSRQYLLSSQTWSRLLHDGGLRQEALSRARRSVHLAAARLRSKARRPLSDSVDVVTALHASGIAVSIGASPGEPILRDLAALPGGLAAVEEFAGPEDAHTLATSGLIRQAKALLDEAARTALADSPAIRAAL